MTDRQKTGQQETEVETEDTIRLSFQQQLLLDRTPNIYRGYNMNNSTSELTKNMSRAAYSFLLSVLMFTVGSSLMLSGLRPEVSNSQETQVQVN